MSRFRPAIHSKHHRPSNRRGAAIVLCTLAAAVLAMASVAILRAGGHRRDRVRGIRSATAARQTLSAAKAQAKAIIDVDSSTSQGIDLNLKAHPDAYMKVIPDGSGSAAAYVYLYPASKSPSAIFTITGAKADAVIKESVKDNPGKATVRGPVSPPARFPPSPRAGETPSSGSRVPRPLGSGAPIAR